MEEPDGGDSDEVLSRVVVNLVEASSQRLLESMLETAMTRELGDQVLLDALANARADEHWDAAVRVADELVAWIIDGRSSSEQWSSTDRDGSSRRHQRDPANARRRHATVAVAIASLDTVQRAGLHHVG